MIVGVDARALAGNRTGIGVHTAEIASRLPEKVVLFSHRPIEDRSTISGLELRVGTLSPGVAWQQLRLPKMLAAAGCDVLWGPHSTLPWNLRIPAVVSLHDFTSITMPLRHRFKTIASFNTLIGWSLGRADEVAAVSRFTADAAMRGFGVPASKITIVPNGVDHPFFSAPGGGDRVGRPYVLSVGTLEPRKGIGTLLAAWRSMRAKPLLVVAGDPGWGESRLRRELEAEAREGNVQLRGFVDRDELRDLYQHALAFVYPARGEGFGLPPLEAMASGCPVIAADSGAVPEVTADAALLFRPDDIRALRRALDELLARGSDRDARVERGRERARAFDWGHSARAMHQLFEKAARR